nr:hypothetical protein [Candidatus Sigynarchaeum springense]
MAFSAPATSPLLPAATCSIASASCSSRAAARRATSACASPCGCASISASAWFGSSLAASAI